MTNRKPVPGLTATVGEWCAYAAWAESQMRALQATCDTREAGTAQPLTDPNLTIEIAFKEADRCRAYGDRVLNEEVIVVLANEVIALRARVEALIHGGDCK